jgi:dolichyl-phosphate-mannose--protein O-mannosyl transferase
MDQKSGLDIAAIHGARRDQSVNAARALPPLLKTLLVALVIFACAHFALLVGVATPDELYFDEVHYVPAARQMLGADVSVTQLNPMHPPLAKQLIALSMEVLGDTPLGWRYAGVLFGALAIVAVYLCGLALFGAQSAAIAAATIAFFNQMVFVQSRIAMLDIFALTFGLFATAAFLRGFGERRPQVWFGLAGLACGLSAACKWSGLFVLATCIVIVAAMRLLQAWRVRFLDVKEDDWYRPDLWPDFRLVHFGISFVLIPAAVYFAAFVPVHGFSVPDILEAQRRIFDDNTTTAIAGHTYMSAWPSWPLLVRPVWFLFDKIDEDEIAAVVLLGNPLVFWPMLGAIVICMRDFIVSRQRDALLVLAFYLGPWLAWALLPRTLGFLYYYLPSATFGSLALVYLLRRGNTPRWLLWGFVAVACAGFAAMLPISAAFVGTSMETFTRLMIFQNWI